MAAPRATLALALGLCCAAGQCSAANWPQAAANPARTCHVADQPNGPYRVAWVKGWGSEVIANTCQPILYNGALFVGTANGTIHALELASGRELWTAELGAPIIHALACDEAHVYAAALNGAVYGLERATGRTVWRAKLSRRGFCAAPLLMDGRLYIGNRDGAFYALRASDGKLLWRADTGAPIFHTAAGAEGRVVFVNEAMHAFCLDASSGKVLWRVGPLPGRSVRDYWPVIFRGRVIVRTAQAGPRELAGCLNALQEQLFWPVVYPGQEAKGLVVRFKARSVADILREQEIFARFFREHPYARTFLVLNLADGSEPYVASVVTGCRMTGVPPPPVLAGDGNLYTTFRTSAAYRGLIDITDCGLGRFDINTGKIAQPLICGQKDVGQVIGTSTPFELTSDETVTLSSGGNLIFGFRCDQNGGAIDVTTKRKWTLPPVELPFSSDMLPSGNILTVSDKYVCYVKFNHVICLEGR